MITKSGLASFGCIKRRVTCQVWTSGRTTAFGRRHAEFLKQVVLLTSALTLQANMTHLAHRRDVKLLAPKHPSPEEIESAPRTHYLFGYPIARSASPAFHNLILQLLASRNSSSAYFNGVPVYSLCETHAISKSMRQLVRDDRRFGGASVTMPLKVAITSQLGPNHILDELSPAAVATQAVNTIVVLPPSPASQGKPRMHGTNTDYLGVLHALMRNIATQNRESNPEAYMDRRSQMSGDVLDLKSAPVSYTYPRRADRKPYSAFIIGSGGTCRSSVWALHQLGLSPIYLLNRDETETAVVLTHFKGSIDLRPVHTVEEFHRQRQLRERGNIAHVVIGVGAIPAVKPSTDAEKMVYTLANMFFAEPYGALLESHHSHKLSRVEAQKSITGTFPLPPSRPFLDMCYTPRRTPLLAAAESQGWSPVGGIEAMIEQGLAQARMWAASAHIRTVSSDEDPTSYATRSGDDGPLGADVEDKARRLMASMLDIPSPQEVKISPRL